MKRALILSVCIGMFFIPVFAELPGTFYINAGVQGLAFMGSGFDGSNYFFNDANGVIVPVYDMAAGGGWAVDGGILFDKFPIYVEAHLGQTFHGAQWDDEENVIAAEDSLDSVGVFSRVSFTAGWQFKEKKEFIPEAFIGGGFVGSLADPGVYENDDSTPGGFSGFFWTLGGGARRSLTDKIDIFGRVAYSMDFFNSANWGGDSGKLDPIMTEHELSITIGGRYWLPF